MLDLVIFGAKCLLWTWGAMVVVFTFVGFGTAMHRQREQMRNVI